MEMGEILRNEEEIRNYIIGVAFGGLEDTRRHHKEGGTCARGGPTDRRCGPADRRPMKPAALYLLEASHNQP